MSARPPNAREGQTEGGLGDCVLYFNPECSKCRAAVELLTARGIAFVTRDYRREPPDAAELRALVTATGLPAALLVRRDDTLARELGLGPDTLRSEAEWIALLLAHPSLLQRPLLLCGERAVIGRPPERVLELLPTG
jgi:arsenate reductase